MIPKQRGGQCRGDVVAARSALGRLGNSGNSDAPHLHFQVMDRPSALDANGLPFVFDRMEFQGRMVGTLSDSDEVAFAGGVVEINPVGSGRRRSEMPFTLASSSSRTGLSSRRKRSLRQEAGNQKEGLVNRKHLLIWS